MLDGRPQPRRTVAAGQVAVSATEQDPDLVRELVRFLRRHRPADDRLLRAHQDDGSGHCAVCTTGGQAGRLVWPCQLYTAAWKAAHGC